jgi:hypothetical protein
LGSFITNNAKCTSEIKSRIVMAKAAFNKLTLFTSKLDLKFKEENTRVLALKNGFVWC